MSDTRSWNDQIIDEFRANEGRVGGPFEGAPLLLLHHIGAKSGTERVTPMMYQAVGDDLAVFASYAGEDVHPAWYHNLLANPDTLVQVGSERRPVHARLATDQEYDALWVKAVEAWSGYEEYRRRTDRKIPLVVLEPRAA